MEFSVQDIVFKFSKLYPGKPLIVRSPGRINLIGEHTDYNDGFVMPAAIDRETVFAIAPSDNKVSEIYSLMYEESFQVDIHNPQPVSSPTWVNYLLGVIRQFVDHGYPVKPFRCVFGGNIPMGAGLSSSASIECGFAYALNELYQFNVPKEKMVFMAQWSEHHFAGVKCGIMDQFASMMGVDSRVIVLDCRSMEFSYSPLELTDVALVLCDTKVKHSLVDSEYNTRRNECEEGVRVLQQYHPAIKSLRDVSLTELEKHRAELKGKVYDRCLYIVQEIQRVQEASEDLKRHDLEAFGKKMYETHHGLSELYEVSCEELDFLVTNAKTLPAVLGARMMGGGFGGCTINIVKRSEVENFTSVMKKEYESAFGIALETYVVNIKDGTGLIHEPIGKISLL